MCKIDCWVLGRIQFGGAVQGAVRGAAHFCEIERMAGCMQFAVADLGWAGEVSQ